MANPPPVRPWSRFASLRSVPAPESQPPSATPTFKTNSTPPSQPSSQNGAAPFASSLKSAQERNTSSLDNNANATKSLPTTTFSQKLKLITPPSSSKLNVNNEIEPKIQVEEEKKTVLVNKITERPSVNNGNGSLQKDLHKKLSDSEDSNIRIITIAGENKGAYMEVIQSKKKPNNLHKMGNSKTKANDHESENANRKDKNHKVKTTSSLPRNGVYMNSNVQCINNSLLFHTSCTSNDPGVHLTLSKKPFGEGFHLKERVDGKHN